MFKEKVSTVPGLSSSSAPGAAAAAVHVPAAAVLLHAPAGPLSAAAVLLLAPVGPLSVASVLPSAAFVLYPDAISAPPCSTKVVVQITLAWCLINLYHIDCPYCPDCPS